MARAIGSGHQRIGVMDCVSCSKELPVKKTGGGKLSACCPWCDLPLYVNPGTEAFTRIMARVRLDELGAADQARAPGTSAASANGAPPAEPEKKPDEDKQPPKRSFIGPIW